MGAEITLLLTAATLLLVAAAGTAVVLTRDPGRQAMVLSVFGLLLATAMLVLQAPDVAMSQIAVGGAVVPLLVVLTVAKIGRELGDRHEEQDR